MRSLQTYLLQAELPQFSQSSLSQLLRERFQTRYLWLYLWHYVYLKCNLNSPQDQSPVTAGLYGQSRNGIAGRSESKGQGGS